MYDINLINDPTEKDHGVIIHGINQYANAHGFPSTGSFFYAASDACQKIIAAMSGFDNFGYAEIGGLWVDEQHRHQGYGKALLQKANDWAIQKGCRALTVFTLKNWPACDWYQSHGFTIEYEREGHANNSVGCYLIRTL